MPLIWLLRLLLLTMHHNLHLHHCHHLPRLPLHHCLVPVAVPPLMLNLRLSHQQKLSLHNFIVLTLANSMSYLTSYSTFRHSSE